MAEQQPEKRKISLKLGLGILFLPYVFAWFLLRKDYGTTARLIGLSWAGLFVLMFALGHSESDRAAKQTVAAKAQAVSASAQGAAAPASGAQPAAKLPEVDIAAERAKNKALMVEIQQRFASNREHLKKHFYAPKSAVEQAGKDVITLTAIAFSRGMSKLPEDQKQAAEAKALASQVAEQDREMYASSMEEAFVKNGIDARVRASGKGNERLTITYALMSKPLVYKFQNEWDLPTQAKGIGFKKVVYTNGFESSLGESWTVDL